MYESPLFILLEAKSIKNQEYFQSKQGRGVPKIQIFQVITRQFTQQQVPQIHSRSSNSWIDHLRQLYRDNSNRSSCTQSGCMLGLKEKKRFFREQNAWKGNWRQEGLWTLGSWSWRASSRRTSSTGARRHTERKCPRSKCAHLSRCFFYRTEIEEKAPWNWNSCKFRSRGNLRKLRFCVPDPLLLGSGRPVGWSQVSEIGRNRI